MKFRMKLFPWLFCLVVLAVENTQSQSQSQRQNQSQSQSQSVKEAPNTQFAFSLFEEVKGSQPRSFVLSPFSLRNALAMVILGARGETAEEIQKSIQASKNVTKLINKQTNLIESLKHISSPNSGVEFVTADKTYANGRLRVKTQYKNDVEKLGGEIETVDFGNNLAAAKKINSWVQRKTKGKISKIVESSALNSQTSLLVLNTIYFKGFWKNQFPPSDTRQLPFFIDENQSVNVDMMIQENEFQFADLEGPDAKVILLPYKKERLSMMIYVPKGNRQDSLFRLENWLKNQLPLEIQNKHLKKSEKVLVSLPKFKIRSTLQLNEPLKKLGLGKMFDSATANFSGIFEGYGRFFVSKVSQETFIEVNEEGTEAAAATGFEVAALSFRETPEFKVDRPFVFQIVDSGTKAVLFMGRVKDPRDS